MKCWICGGKGETGEHLIQASDIRMLFPDISPKKPAYKHSHSYKNVRIGSPKSNKLKSKAKICAKCSNQLTQPHDNAWKKASEYSSLHWDVIVKSRHLNLKDVFEHDVMNCATNLHLFFLKKLGFLFVEWGIDGIVGEFSNSIIHQKSHDMVFLSLLDISAYHNKKYLGYSDLDCTYLNENELVYASFIYAKYPYGFVVAYVNPEYTEERKLSKGWNPSNGKTVIQVI